jgi:hypothetical protein
MSVAGPLLRLSSLGSSSRSGVLGERDDGWQVRIRIHQAERTNLAIAASSKGYAAE